MHFAWNLNIISWKKPFLAFVKSKDKIKIEYQIYQFLIQKNKNENKIHFIHPESTEKVWVFSLNVEGLLGWPHIFSMNAGQKNILWSPLLGFTPARNYRGGPKLLLDSYQKVRFKIIFQIGLKLFKLWSILFAYIS